MKDSAAKRRTPAVVDPDALTRDELRRLAKADKKLGSADPTVAASGRRELRDLEHRHAERLAGQSLATRLAETSSLARARGEEVRAESVRIAVPLVDEHGVRIVRQGLPLYRTETASRVRIASRGGLQLAFDRGDLDRAPVKAERLLDVARAYRRAFEAATGLTTPQRNLAPVSSRAPLRASAGPQERVFAAGELLRLFRDGLADRQVAVLDRVCGLDLTLRAAALDLRADPRTVRKALVEGLTQAEANRRAGSDRRENPSRSEESSPSVPESA